ncbi:MAG: DNA-binding domain-containing protein [Pseudomonadota bacterium]
MSDFRATQEAFTRYVRDPETNPTPPGSRPERMAWYAQLFRNNIDGILDTAFPALHAALPADNWHALVKRFFRDRPLHSPLLRDVPPEFVDFVTNDDFVANDDSLADWQRELATYELARFELLTAEDPEPPADLDPDGDPLAGRPVASPLARLMLTTWPVDAVAAAAEAGDTPQPGEPAEYHLLVFRDNNGAPVCQRLSAPSARLLALLAGETAASGQSTLTRLAEEMGMPAEELIPFAAPQLAKWRATGVLLGSIPAQ